MAELGLNKTSEQIMRSVHTVLEQLGPGSSVSVGFMEGSMAGYNGPRPLHGRQETARRADAKGHQEPAAQVAFWNEYGTTSSTVGAAAPGNIHIPPRPFFRTMIAKQSPTWGRLAMGALKLRKFNSEEALKIMGVKIGEQLQESIIDFKNPRNADSTVEGKGFDDPLIDSHNMLRSVEYQVSGGERTIVNGGA